MTNDEMKRIANHVIGNGDGLSWENPPVSLLCQLLREFSEIDRIQIFDHLDRTITSRLNWGAEQRKSAEEYFGPRYFWSLDGRYWCGGECLEESIENAIKYPYKDEAEQSGPRDWDAFKGKPLCVVAVPYPEWTKCKG